MIAVQVYNRAEHAIRVFESLKTNKVQSFLVSFDKANNQHTELAQSEILRYLDKQKSLSIETIFNSEQLGAARSCVKTVTAVLEKQEEIIFLEDDCLLRAGGIEYFLDGLTALKANRKIRTICGYNYPLGAYYWGDNPELLLAKRFSTWGWATWRNRWIEYTSDLKYLIQNCQEKGITLDSIGSDIERMLSQNIYLHGNKNVWSLSWTLQHFLTDTYAVLPRVPVIDNIGFDGTGVNSNVTTVFNNAALPDTMKKINWSEMSYYLRNDRIIRTFLDEQSHNIF